jgi:hypothetical protein
VLADTVKNPTFLMTSGEEIKVAIRAVISRVEGWNQFQRQKISMAFVNNLAT